MILCLHFFSWFVFKNFWRSDFPRRLPLGDDSTSTSTWGFILKFFGLNEDGELNKFFVSILGIVSFRRLSPTPANQPVKTFWLEMVQRLDLANQSVRTFLAEDGTAFGCSFRESLKTPYQPIKLLS